MAGENEYTNYDTGETYGSSGLADMTVGPWSGGTTGEDWSTPAWESGGAVAGIGGAMSPYAPEFTVKDVLPNGDAILSDGSQTVTIPYDAPQDVWDGLKTLISKGWNALDAKGIAALGQVGLNLYGANKATQSLKDAASQQQALFAPYQQIGLQGVQELNNFNTANKLPSYDELVTNQLGGYANDPGVQAQKALAMKGLAEQQHARGLASSAVSGNAAAELGMKYDTTGYDRFKQTLADRYKAKMGEYGTGYDQITNKLKIGQNAAGSISPAIASSGAADAGYYKGLQSVPLEAAKTYDAFATMGSGGLSTAATTTPNTASSTGFWGTK